MIVELVSTFFMPFFYLPSIPIFCLLDTQSSGSTRFFNCLSLRRLALGQISSATDREIKVGRALFPASKPLEAAEGAARTQQPRWGRLRRHVQIQQHPFSSRIKATLREHEQPGAQWTVWANSMWCISQGVVWQWGHGAAVQASRASRKGALTTLFEQSLPTVVVTCSWRAQPWYPLGRKTWPLHLLRTLQPQLLMWLPRHRSQGNMVAQVLGCRVCPSLLSVSDGISSGYGCGMCPQGEELLSLVVDLREEVSRLRSIRVSEREIHRWKHTLSTHPEAHSWASHNTRNKGSPIPPGSHYTRDKSSPIPQRQ